MYGVSEKEKWKFEEKYAKAANFNSYLFLLGLFFLTKAVFVAGLFTID